MDRADFDAAAGRTVFQNVLLADPQAFSSRPRLRRGESRAVVTAPATTGDAAADRRTRRRCWPPGLQLPPGTTPVEARASCRTQSRSAPCELFCPRRMGDKAHVRSESEAREGGQGGLQLASNPLPIKPDQSDSLHLSV
jgi:hypothetical protein